jgi:hypothetical protein
MSDTLQAKRDFKIGMAHVDCALDYAIETKDRALAEKIYRDAMQRVLRVSREFGFELQENTEQRRKAA